MLLVMVVKVPSSTASTVLAITSVLVLLALRNVVMASTLMPIETAKTAAWDVRPVPVLPGVLLASIPLSLQLEESAKRLALLEPSSTPMENVLADSVSFLKLDAFQVVFQEPMALAPGLARPVPILVQPALLLPQFVFLAQLDSLM